MLNRNLQVSIDFPGWVFYVTDISGSREAQGLVFLEIKLRKAKSKISYKFFIIFVTELHQTCIVSQVGRLEIHKNSSYLTVLHVHLLQYKK